jgi:hypothetical protein
MFFFFSDPDPTFQIVLDPDPDLFRILHEICESVSASRALRDKFEM